MFRSEILAERMHDVIEAARAIVNEARISLQERGLELKAINSASVAMVSLRIDASAFELYQVTPGEIGIDLVRLEDALSSAGKSELVKMELLEDERKLKIRIGSLSYTLGLIDPGTLQREPKIPELDLPASVTIPGAELRRAIKASELVSDHVVLGVRDDVFYMDARGDVDTLSFTMPSSELLDMKPGEARSMFSLEYLSAMSRVFGRAPAVKLEIGIDYPLQISFWLNEAHVSYLLAPRIEEE